MIATTILAKVEAGRLGKAVEGLANGAYSVTLAQQGEEEIRGFVTNGDGKEYGVVLSADGAFCSCKDAMYRRGICKHAVVLALYTIRTPTAEDKPQTEAGLPKLARMRTTDELRQDGFFC
ncbi:MAG: SWIM zinc finger family protein [Candidatus Binatia bacterium]